MRRSRSAVSLCCIFLFIFLQFPIVTSIDIPDDIRNGPFIDKVVYKNIIGSGVTMALQAGVLDIGGIYYSDFSYLDTDPDIDVLETPMNGYRCITINCDKYPLNISGFRRAFAFAFNKTKAVDYRYEGHATLHDSVVPSTNRWCAEDLLEYHYYDADIERGNAILDELGFTLNTTTGFREAPNGEQFSVIGYHGGSIQSAIVAQLARETLDSLNIANEWYYPFNFSNPDSYGMLVFGGFYRYDTIVWEYSYSNYRNDTLSYWIGKFYDGKTYEEVFEASTEIQKNLHYNVPQLVLCQANYVEAIRNDQFQGVVKDTSRYFSGPWTLRRIHKIDGSYGGSFSIALPYIGWPISFNFYTNLYSKRILDNVYSSLYSRDPNMNPIPDLAESMLVETHGDNPSVPQNHTRFTFDILQNATWSDGTSLTAEDIAFTFLYQLESRAYGNPAADSLTELVAVFTPSPDKVVFEFSSESYWHFNKIAYEYIIPQHVFSGIGYSGWNTWNPVVDPEEPHVTCGPFVFTDFGDGPPQYYELSQNPLFHRYQPPPPQPPTTNNTSTPPLIFQIMPIALGTAYTIVTVGIIVLLIKDRKTSD